MACFKPICDECIIRYQGQDYCSGECAEGAEKAGIAIGKISAGQERVKRKRTIKKILFFIILIVIGFFIYFNNATIMKILKSWIGETKMEKLIRPGGQNGFRIFWINKTEQSTAHAFAIRYYNKH